MVNSTDSDPLTRYPLTLHLGDASFVLRLIAPTDHDAIVDLARRQPPEDLLYLRRDLTRPEVVDDWLARAAAGQITVLVAQAGTGIVAYAGIDRGDVGWTSHVRELRVLVDAEARRQGLGRKDMAASAARRQHDSPKNFGAHGSPPRLGRRRVRASTMPMARARASMEEPP